MSECVCVCAATGIDQLYAWEDYLIKFQFFSHEYFHLPIFSSSHRDKLHSVPHKCLVINSY